MPWGALLAGRELQQSPPALTALVLEHPDATVRRLLDAANPRAHVVALELGGVVAVEADTHDGPGRQPGRKGVTAPVFEELAPVNHEIARRDDRRPGDHGLGELRTGVVIGYFAAVVVIAVGDDRITVIRAAHDAVQLVAVRGTHLGYPELTVAVESHAQRVAMAQRPYLVVGTDAIDQGLLLAVVDEGVVRRNRAVLLETQDLAHVALHVLGRCELLPIAGGYPQIAVVVEGETMTVMTVVEHFRILAPDDLRVGEPAPALAELEHGSHDRRTPCVADTALGVAQVDDPVIGVLRVQDHVAQPALAAVIDVRQSFDRS